MNNIDKHTVNGFGKEWSRFDQSDLSQNELGEIFDSYFSIFPWGDVPEAAVGFDLGCGSGRWANFVAPRVGLLHCIDPSPEALAVARRTLRRHSNCRFHLAAAENIPLPDESADFGYSLGVLHHVPDPRAGLKFCTSKLKPGAPFLVYLYYAFDNRSRWFKAIWRLSDTLRKTISKMPDPLRYAVSQWIAFLVYLPLSRCALLFERLGLNVNAFPLSYYRHRSYYVIRNDALDRFGTRLEHRFTRDQIQDMAEEAGLERIVFRETAPYWCAVGYKRCAA
jgi:SAM-dependent methyltransferase